MNKTSIAAKLFLSTGLFAAALVIMTRCSSVMVSVTSEPSGAKVFSRGAGRMGYKWENKGTTPVKFETPFLAQNTMVLWPDGTKSEVKYSDLAGLETIDIHFNKNLMQATTGKVPDKKE